MHVFDVVSVTPEVSLGGVLEHSLQAHGNGKDPIEEVFVD
jgi:hypothetical protein